MRFYPALVLVEKVSFMPLFPASLLPFGRNLWLPAAMLLALLLALGFYVPATDFALLLLVATTLAAIFMLWNAYANLRRTLGGSADEIHAQMIRITRGDFSSDITVSSGMENSMLADLGKMQKILHAQAIAHKLSEDAMRASTEHLNEAQRHAHRSATSAMSVLRFG